MGMNHTASTVAPTQPLMAASVERTAPLNWSPAAARRTAGDNSPARWTAGDNPNTGRQYTASDTDHADNPPSAAPCNAGLGRRASTSASPSSRQAGRDAKSSLHVSEASKIDAPMRLPSHAP